MEGAAAATTSVRRKRALSFMAGMAGLAAFLAWQASSLDRYIRAESRPPAWDQSVHLETALDYARYVRGHDWRAVLHAPPKPGMPPFPPLFHLGLIPAVESPNPAGTALWLNFAYLAVLCVSLFGICWHFNPGGAALPATLAFAGAPIVQELLLNQQMDLAVAACVALAYWLYFLSDSFSLWSGSLAFGLACALGMLHKWTFFSYMLPLLWMALLALGWEERRLQVLCAGLIAAAGSAVWYVPRFPDLLPRLFAAAGDNAVPFWREGAFFSYFLRSATDLGPLLWIIGWISVAVPGAEKNREKIWLVPAWALMSYVFWAIVPNRQMRFLLPGLPALAVLTCAPWPKAVLWIVALVQVFTAANFTSRWVQPLDVRTPVLSFQFFPSSPPVREDWRIADILKDAERRRPKDEPFANLTLVANDVRFNGPTFNWIAKSGGFPGIRMRGVNRRLCEFSEFVLLKRGNLGPPGVTSGLFEAAAAIDAPDGWFQKAYAEAARWPLPDGSTAVLYQQRKPAAPPFPVREYSFPYYEAPVGRFWAKNLRIDLGKWDSASSVYPAVAVSADALNMRGLDIRDVRVEMSGVRLAPAGKKPRQAPWEDVRLLKMSRLRILSLRLTADALKEFAQARAPWLSVRKAELDGNVRLQADYKGIPLSVEASVGILKSPPQLDAAIRRLILDIVSVPPAFLGHYQAFSLPLSPNPETPFDIDIPGLSVKKGVLSIP